MPQRSCLAACFPVLVAAFACAAAAARAGVRFGEHRASSGGVAEYAGWQSITPEEFYRNHAQPGVPAIFRGAALDWEPRTLWTDDFLESRFGDLVVLTEDKLDDRSEGPQSMSIREFVRQYRADGQDRAPILPVRDGTDHSWVESLPRSASPVSAEAGSPAAGIGRGGLSAGAQPRPRPWSRFLVSQTPDPMLAGIPLFPLLRCSAYTGSRSAPWATASNHRRDDTRAGAPPTGSSGDPPAAHTTAGSNGTSAGDGTLPRQPAGRSLLVESNLWLSSGNTASTWHEDADATLNCLLQGHKHWFMVDPRNRADVGMKDRGLSSAFSDVDVDDVLSSAGPPAALPNPAAEYESFVAHGGDCVYLPARRPHHVRSYPGRNLALTTLFEAPAAWPEGRDDDCAFDGPAAAAAALAARNVSLADVGLRWGFSGQSPEDVSMGLEDVSVVAEQFAGAAATEGRPDRLSLGELCGAVRGHVEQHLPETGGTGLDEAGLRRECGAVMQALAEAAGIGSGATGSEVASWLGRPGELAGGGAGIPVSALRAVGRCDCRQAGRVVRLIEACLLSKCVEGAVGEEEDEEEDDGAAQGRQGRQDDDDVAAPWEEEEEDNDEEDGGGEEEWGLLDALEDADDEGSATPPQGAALNGREQPARAGEGGDDRDRDDEDDHDDDEDDHDDDEDDHDEDAEWALHGDEEPSAGVDGAPPRAARFNADHSPQDPRHLAPGEAAPPGHMEPLGAHRPSDGPIATEEDGASVAPRDLWHKYVKPRVPVILRGVAAGWPALSRWRDDAALARAYGWLEVRLEEKWEREDDAGLVRGERGFARDTVESFLSRYNRSGTNAYVVSQIPDAMRADLPVPSFLACAPLADRLMELNLWISSGDTRSIVHRDPHNFANCLLAGAKNWTFIEPAFQSDVPMEPEAEHEAGGASQIDVRAVDLLRFPRFRRVRYRRVLQLPGDCIVSPGAYLHQVDSLPGRNMAVAFLFGRLEGLGTAGALDAAFEDEGGVARPPSAEQLEALALLSRHIDAWQDNFTAVQLASASDRLGWEAARAAVPGAGMGPPPMDDVVAGRVTAAAGGLLTAINTVGRLAAAAAAMPVNARRAIGASFNVDPSNTPFAEYASVSLSGVKALLRRWARRAETGERGREFDHARESSVTRKYLEGLPGTGPGADVL
ncbi:hypothetical protein FNF29_03800 [Cafeteria roenbergensis]|uniref:JmjC domain-containing protein n=1 Tax=Cafeteria roenbergensis TaxID=33653 RepID=A0A5A8CHQ1_CAFRO|nr:hypothetical protein FNF29_03800 [Cafeteria roenbergensis]|eukprot:KAA0152573.1 hypothetical protein FNF29_03800 [Cafeteria roenbergensis]